MPRTNGGCRRSARPDPGDACIEGIRISRIAGGGCTRVVVIDDYGVAVPPDHALGLGDMGISPVHTSWVGDVYVCSTVVEGVEFTGGALSLSGNTGELLVGGCLAILS